VRKTKFGLKGARNYFWYNRAWLNLSTALRFRSDQQREQGWSRIRIYFFVRIGVESESQFYHKLDSEFNFMNKLVLLYFKQVISTSWTGQTGVGVQIFAKIGSWFEAGVKRFGLRVESELDFCQNRSRIRSKIQMFHSTRGVKKNSESDHLCSAFQHSFIILPLTFIIICFFSFSLLYFTPLAFFHFRSIFFTSVCFLLLSLTSVCFLFASVFN